MGTVIFDNLGKKVQGFILGLDCLIMKIKTFIHSFLRNQTILFVIGGLIPPALNLLFLPIYSLYLSPEEFGIMHTQMHFNQFLLCLALYPLVHIYSDFILIKTKMIRN